MYGGGVYGGGFMNQNTMFDESGNIQDNEDTVSTIAMTLGFNFYGGSERQDKETSKERLDVLLSQYQLDRPENYDLRDRVFSQVALSLAQREMSMEGGSFDFSFEYKSTDALNEFERTLSEANIPLPSEMSSAYQLKDLIEQAGDDHLEFLREVDVQFVGDQKQKILMDSMMRFHQDADSKRDFIQEILKGEVDQDFLNMLLNNELMTRNNPWAGDPTPGLLELIAEHVDFDHKAGFANENILCQTLAPSFYYTEMGQRQAEESMREFDNAILEGGSFPGSGFGGGMGGGMGGGFPGTTVFSGDGADASEEYLTAREFTEDTSYHFAPSSPEVIKRQQESMKKMASKIAQENVKILLSVGADPNVICKDGMSVNDKLFLLEEEGLFDKGLSSEYGNGPSESGTPCVGHLDDSDFVGLCDTVSILATLNNKLKGNEKLREGRKSSGILNNIYGEGNSRCNFVLIDKMMTFGSMSLGREIELEISPNGSKRSFFIKGKDKEEFLNKLRVLIK
ncbi:MAG: hypothetical protein ACJAT2_001222 [Bacteriovoracaceae bacterium]|jgi:hypothetical protein